MKKHSRLLNKYSNFIIKFKYKKIDFVIKNNK